MKSARKALLSCALGAAICLAFALSIYVGFARLQPDPLLSEPPAELRERIAQIHDIEHLRSVALALDAVGRESVRDFNVLLAMGVQLLIAAFLLGGLCCLASLPYLVRLMLEQDRANAPGWLRWL